MRPTSLLNLSLGQCRDLARAYFLLLKAQIWTRRGGDLPQLPATRSSKAGNPVGLAREQENAIANAVWGLDIASRHPFRWAMCLQKSLALYWWAGSKGIETELHIGVRKEESKLVAHAWVEHQGRVLNDLQHTPALYAPLTPVAAARGRCTGREERG